MSVRSKSRRKAGGQSWWLALVLPVAAILFAVWFFLIHESETFTGKKVTEKTEADQSLCAEAKQETGISEINGQISGDLPSPETPWIALIIDDFGFPATAGVVDGFLSLPFEVTFSIIPGNIKSVSIGNTVHAAGGEVFIHLPMEPTRKVAMGERDMVLVGMDAVDLEVILDRVTGELPFAVGLNNHMGSKATLDEPLMRMLAFELKKRDMVFIDSRTVEGSRAYTTMISAGVPALGRDVFIDNKGDPVGIPNRIRELLRIARHNGWAVGIGHARQTTLNALVEILPAIDESGVRFITAGELIEAVCNMRRRTQVASGDTVVN